LKKVYAIPIYYTILRYKLGTHREGRTRLETIIDANIQLVHMSPIYLAGFVYMLIRNPSLYGFLLGLKLLLLSLIFYITTQIIYEIGYLVNDNIAYFKEGKKGRNVFGEFLSIKEIIIYSVIRIFAFCVIIVALAYLFSIYYISNYVIISLCLLIVFIVYNFTIPRNRAMYLFFPLRILKYTTMFYPLIHNVGLLMILPYIIGLSLEGTITYALRKIPNDEIKLQKHLYQTYLQLLITTIVFYILFTLYGKLNYYFATVLLIVLISYVITLKLFRKVT